MSRWVLPVAIAAILALAAVALVNGLGSAAPTRAEQAQRLAAELRCPDCAGLSVAESTSASAAAIRAEIVAQLAGGSTPDQVRRHFVERYGEWILLSPTAPLAWLLPVLVVLAGLVGLAVWLARSRTSSAAPAVSPSAVDLQRVRDEAEALDA
jgi:cytochrome c-type biogenesis protein CcmH/NrfF